MSTDKHRDNWRERRKEITQELADQIDSLLRNEMVGEELDSFKERLEQESWLRDEIELEKAVSMEIKAVGQQKADKEWLKKIHQQLYALDKVPVDNGQDDETIKVDLPPPSPPRSNGNFFGLSYSTLVGFSLAAAMIIALLFFWPSSNKSNTNPTHKHEVLFKEYYQPYNGALISPTKGNDQLSKAVNHYLNGEYETALKGIQSLQSAEQTDLSTFYLGLASIEMNDFELANLSLSSIVDTESSDVDLESVSKWYQALVSLRMDMPNECIKIMKVLKSENGPYSLKAEKFLRHIDY